MKNINKIEIWKNIPGVLNGFFQVSNFGRIKRLERFTISSKGRKCHYKEKMIKLGINRGYSFFCYCINGVSGVMSAHRAVALAFIPNPENKKEVNHKDGDKSNNTPENLEWCTRKENMHHASVNGLLRPVIGKNNKRSIRIDMLDFDTNQVLQTFDSIGDAARFLGSREKYSTKLVSCCKHKRKSCHGYKWKYHNETVTTIESHNDE